MSKLPPGYHFNPKDDELINHYIWRRALYGVSSSCPRMPLVDSIFGENADHPSTVFDSFGQSDREEEDTVRYFFTIPKNVSSDKDYSCVKNRIRTAGKHGTWKLQRSDPVVVKNTSTGQEEVIGFRKLLKFMESTSNGVEWSMHEFTSKLLEEKINNVNNFVLCRITKKPSTIRQKRLHSVSVANTTTNNDNDNNVDVQENKRQHISLVPAVMKEQGVSYDGIFNQQVGVPVDNNNVVLGQHHQQQNHVQENHEQLGCGDDMLSIQDYSRGSDFDLAPEWSSEGHNNQELQELVGSDFDHEAELAKFAEEYDNEVVCVGDQMLQGHVDDESGSGDDMISMQDLLGSDFDIEAELAKYCQGDNNLAVWANQLELQQ
ncbi:NAC domain-containing protein 14-like [Chenopodium quinoa]|uniref:NAC domain-containing protein 14-like n=1 Tax=Chenopodium quinoa TaxID=63459 RepID=UPI000B792166|nr:NAC domain-containing protein 14-like [Chenopodium quinoa]